jgi:hypothetical protein
LGLIQPGRSGGRYIRNRFDAVPEWKVRGPMT